MTVEELISTTLIKQADIIAGTDGINRPVSWCMPDIHLQMAGIEDRWLMPGTLLLHAGSVQILENQEYRDFLKKQEISGLFLLGEQADEKSNIYCDENREEENGLKTKEIYNFFNKERIPLVHLSNVNNVLSFTKRISSLLCMDTNEEQRQEDWLREICYSENTIPSQVIAEHYGYEKTMKYVSINFRLKKNENPNQFQQEYDMRWLKNMLKESLAWCGVLPLQFVDNDELVCFAPTCNENRRERQARVQKEVERIRCISKGKRKITATASLDEYSLDDFSKGFQKMKKTEALIKSLGVHESLSCYENWSMHMLLLREPHTELQGYVEQVIGVLCRDKDLLETLTIYLTTGENLKKTAEILYVHTNTLKYRLEKISKLLECDLKDPDTRFRLRMAITVHRCLSK